MKLRFYHDPLIDRDHHVIREEGRPPERYFSFELDLPDFTPHWSGTRAFDIPASIPDTPNNSVPNYAVVHHQDHDFCYFVVNPQAVTPDTIRVDLMVDWWGTYHNDLYWTGKQMRVQSSNQFYTVPAKFDPKDLDVKAHAIGAASFVDGGTPASLRYCVVSVLQCYYDDHWPFADGEPFQVTTISRGSWTGDQLNFSTNNPTVSAALSPKFFGSSWTSVAPLIYRVIAILRQQLIPYDMVHSALEGEDFFDTSYSGLWYGTATEAEGSGYNVADCFVLWSDGRSTSPPLFGSRKGTLYRRYDVKTRPDAVARNTARRRLFLGNIHSRIALPDRRIVADAGNQTVATLRLTLTLNEGMKVELDEGDRLTDISTLFDVGVTFNNEAAMAYAAGDAKTLGAISSGISAAGQAIAGASMLATGNPLGLLGLAGAASTAVGAVSSLQYRGREEVVGGKSTAKSDILDWGALFQLIEVKVQNFNERAYDVFRRGYEIADHVGTNGIPLSLLLLTSETLHTAGHAISPDSYLWLAPTRLIPATSRLSPAPDTGTLEQAVAELARGVLVVDSTVEDVSTVYNGGHEW